MIETESPGAVAALGASKSDRLGRQVFSEANSQQQFAQGPICAELIGLDRCEAEGFIARGHAPALELCRELVAAGFSPASPLEAWRGNTLCLRVRSIGEAARLPVADDRHGTPRLRRRQDCPQRYVRGSPIAQTVIGRDVAAPAQQATWEPAP
jgi:hypothetical protein